MSAPIKKQFNYYVTNLNWGDGTPREYVDKPKLFDRSFNFEHNYERPGFYTVTGLVFKYAYLMLNLYPESQEDMTLEYMTNEDSVVVAADDLYTTDFTPTVKNIRTIREEEQYIRFGGFNISQDSSGAEGSATDGLQYTPSSLNAYRITKTDNSATNVFLYNGNNDNFLNSIQVRVGSSGGDTSPTYPVQVQEGYYNMGYVQTRTRPSGARINVNVHMDSDNNNLFEYKFEAWLPNFGRQTEIPPSPVPTTTFNPPAPLNAPALLNPPSSPPVGYLENTSGNAQTIEPQPPDRGSQITSTYNLEFFDGDFGTTTAFWGGEGAWVVTNVIPGNDSLYTWSPNLNVLPQYTQDGAISDDGLWEWNYVITPSNPGEGVWVWRENIVSDDGLWIYDGSQWLWNQNSDPSLRVSDDGLWEYVVDGTGAQWVWRENIFSEDQQWVYNGEVGTWMLNEDYNFFERDPVNNPTRYLIRIVGAEPVYDEDGNATLTVDWGSTVKSDTFVVGTSSWKTYTGQFYARKKFIRLYVDVRQLDHTKDYRPVPQTLPPGFPEDIFDFYGAPPWSFFLRKIEMNFQNNSDFLFPLEWEKFQSNFIVNSKPKYDSPLYEKNNFLLIGGLSKESFHFKTLASLLGYDFITLIPRENFNFEKYNPYDVITGLDTLAKYDSSLYNEYLNPYVEEVYSYGELIHNGFVDTKWHGTFENTELKQTDIGAVKIFKGVKPMWEQLGFSSDEFDKPDKDFYWKNIHTGGLEERDGITQRDLPDPMKGALTPRIPRKEYIVDEEASQTWNNNAYWPNLPKFNSLGVLSDVYPPGKDSNFSYGSDNSSIESIRDSDPDVIFELGFEESDELITDNSENFQVKINKDFKLVVDRSGRLTKQASDFSDDVETKKGMPY